MRSSEPHNDYETDQTGRASATLTDVWRARINRFAAWEPVTCRPIGAIASHVISLLAEILGSQPEREKTYAWALGDVSPKTGRAALLPFDAVWEDRQLIVEVDEDQHRRAVKFWDKPDVLTVSGVSRGDQRGIYSRRKRETARAMGYMVLEIPWERKPPPDKRDRDDDRRQLVELLRGVGVEL